MSQGVPMHSIPMLLLCVLSTSAGDRNRRAETHACHVHISSSSIYGGQKLMARNLLHTSNLATSILRSTSQSVSRLSSAALEVNQVIEHGLTSIRCVRMLVVKLLLRAFQSLFACPQ